MMRLNCFVAGIMWAFTLLLLAACAPKAELPVQVTGEVRGKIFDSMDGSAVPLAVVSSQPPTSSVTVGDNGTYSIEDVAPGEYTIMVESHGYTKGSAKVSVQTGRVTTADIQLTKLPVRASAGSKQERENIALNKPVLVSGVYNDQVGAMAVDGKISTAWNSGGFPSQWMEIDLLAAVDIRAMELVVAQSPAGRTKHLIYSRASREDKWRLGWTVEGETRGRQVLRLDFFARPWLGQRYVRVVTESSPSWVAWKEIRIFE